MGKHELTPPTSFADNYRLSAHNETGRAAARPSSARFWGRSEVLYPLPYFLFQRRPCRLIGLAPLTPDRATIRRTKKVLKRPTSGQPWPRSATLSKFSLGL